VIQKMVHEIEQDINLAKIEDVPAERSQLLTSVHDKLDVIQDFFATEFLALKKCLIAPTRDMTTITTHLNDLSLFVDANEVGFYGILDVFDRSFSRRFVSSIFFCFSAALYGISYSGNSFPDYVLFVVDVHISGLFMLESS